MEIRETKEQRIKIYSFDDLKQIYDNPDIDDVVEGFDFFEQDDYESEAFYIETDLYSNVRVGENQYLVLSEDKTVLSLSKSQLKFFLKNENT